MDTRRYTIDLDPAFSRKLANLAEIKGTTKADIIKRALASYSFLSDQTLPDSNRKVSITDQHDRVIKDVMLP